MPQTSKHREDTCSHLFVFYICVRGWSLDQRESYDPFTLLMRIGLCPILCTVGVLYLNISFCFHVMLSLFYTPLLYCLYIETILFRLELWQRVFVKACTNMVFQQAQTCSNHLTATQRKPRALFEYRHGPGDTTCSNLFITGTVYKSSHQLYCNSVFKSL